MYENAFNAIERQLRAEDGIANELDYVEQISWLLFLKYLHDFENERRDLAELKGNAYTPIIEGRFHWDQWAAPGRIHPPPHQLQGFERVAASGNILGHLASK